MPRFLFSHRVPKDYQPSAETGKAWEAWFQSRGGSRIDPGHGVLATRTLGNRDAGTLLGGYSVVTAENLEGAAAPSSSSLPASKRAFRARFDNAAAAGGRRVQPHSGTGAGPCQRAGSAVLLGDCVHPPSAVSGADVDDLRWRGTALR